MNSTAVVIVAIVAVILLIGITMILSKQLGRIDGKLDAFSSSTTSQAAETVRAVQVVVQSVKRVEDRTSSTEASFGDIGRQLNDFQVHASESRAIVADRLNDINTRLINESAIQSQRHLDIIDGFREARDRAAEHDKRIRDLEQHTKFYPKALSNNGDGTD